MKCEYCNGEGKYSLEEGYQRENNKIECHECLGTGDVQPCQNQS